MSSDLLARVRRRCKTMASVALERLDRYEARAILPESPRSDDLYLVEFPKSGVTWLTFLIANTNLLISGEKDRRATFFNINHLVPDIHAYRQLSDTPPTRLPGFRIIKSHAPYTPYYARVIYLVRNPVDVMASYLAFLRSTKTFSGSIEELVEHPKFGIDAWSTHVSGWLTGVTHGDTFTFLRYEDLIRDTVGELEALYLLFGLQPSKEVLSEAVMRSGIDSMRKDDRTTSRRHPAKHGLEFVRSADAGGPREIVSTELRERIEHKTASLLARLGYSQHS